MILKGISITRNNSFVKIRVKIFMLLSPFILMIVINESCRKQLKATPYSIHGLTAMNPELWVKEKCSWACHNSSTFCESNHIRYIRPYKNYIDPIYFGMIRFLNSFHQGPITGYAAANIVFLVITYELI